MSKVQILKQSNSQLMVQYCGELIPHQEAPPRPGTMPASNGVLAPTPELAQVVRNPSRHGLSRFQLPRLAALEAAVLLRQVDDEAPCPRLRHPERPPRASRPCERQYTTPGCRVSLFEASRGNWVFPRSRCASTSTPWQRRSTGLPGGLPDHQLAKIPTGIFP